VEGVRRAEPDIMASYGVPATECLSDLIPSFQGAPLQ